MVVVDKLTRYALYMPMRTTDSAQEVFALLNQHVLANHGTPSAIVSDRDSRFTSHFWEALWAGLRTALKRSTAFHPQTDGQTERQNRTLVEALRAYVDAHQGNWDVLLPQLQLANNTAVCASTGQTPFAMVYGRAARTELDAALEADGVAPRGAHPGAKELAERIAAAERSARALTEKAQAKQRADSQRGRREGELAVGDQAWLSNRNLRLAEHGRARKLEPLYFGPYEVLEMHGSNAAKLRLPAGCRLHPVFNLDLLRKYVDGRAEFPERPQQDARPGPLPQEDPAAGGPGEPEYDVEAVIGKRGRGARLQYRVKWAGWPVEQASWLPVAECDSCAEAVADFEQRQLEQQRRVGAVHALQLRHCDVRVREWRARAAGDVPSNASLPSPAGAEEQHHAHDAAPAGAGEREQPSHTRFALARRARGVGSGGRSRRRARMRATSQRQLLRRREVERTCSQQCMQRQEGRGAQRRGLGGRPGAADGCRRRGHRRLGGSAGGGRQEDAAEAAAQQPRRQGARGSRRAGRRSFLRAQGGSRGSPST